MPKFDALLNEPLALMGFALGGAIAGALVLAGVGGVFALMHLAAQAVLG